MTVLMIALGIGALIGFAYGHAGPGERLSESGHFGIVTLLSFGGTLACYYFTFAGRPSVDPVWDELVLLIYWVLSFLMAVSSVVAYGVAFWVTRALTGRNDAEEKDV